MSDLKEQMMVFDRRPDRPGRRIMSVDRTAGRDTHLEAFVGADGVIRVTRMLQVIPGGKRTQEPADDGEGYV